MSNFYGPRGLSDLASIVGPLFWLALVGLVALVAALGYGLWWLWSHLAWVS